MKLKSKLVDTNTNKQAYLRIRVVDKLISIAEKLIKESKFLNNDGKTEYFVNPTIKELDSFESGVVRFIADNNTKQVYCWDGEKVLHTEALNFLKLPGASIDDLVRGTLLGTADKQGGKYVMFDSDRLAYLFDRGAMDNKRIAKMLNEILNKIDWSWLKSYIDVTNCVKGYREELAFILGRG